MIVNVLLVVRCETFHLYKYPMALFFLLRISEETEKVYNVILKLKFKGNQQIYIFFHEKN